MSAHRHRAPTTSRRKNTENPLAHINPEAIAAQQDVKAIENPEELYADFWPEEETAEEFVAAVRQWRREGNKRRGG
jgi:hypothetical protein